MKQSAVRPTGHSCDGLSRCGDTVECENIGPVEEVGAEESGDRECASDMVVGESYQQGNPDGGDDEEGDEVKVRRTPKGPTRREREEHEATHIPYRDWCRHCIRGRAPNRPHRRANPGGEEEEESRRVPRISMDYFFMAQEGERANEYPMIVMVDDSTGNKYMRAVAKKGLG